MCNEKLNIYISFQYILKHFQFYFVSLFFIFNSKNCIFSQGFPVTTLLYIDCSLYCCCGVCLENAMLFRFLFQTYILIIIKLTAGLCGSLASACYGICHINIYFFILVNPHIINNCCRFRHELQFMCFLIKGSL